ncbi:MAG: ADP-forming succinate--CoA ligase subunit beta [Erysipelotrichaceae bacterium]|nr:ADP-forming succinate--CoA ligase subunit beta [Erysipelotrichaceae bacterium]
MNIHEYQAKQLFKEYDIPVLEGYPAFSVDDVEKIMDEHFPEGAVLKAQIHSGGRGKAGGVLIANSKEEALKKANELFGKILVTKQTGPEGKLVRKIYLEQLAHHDEEYYLSLLVDTKAAKCCFVASVQGGVSIEEVAETDPDAIFRMHVDPVKGINEQEAYELASKLELKDGLKDQFVTMIGNMYRLFIERDCSLIEINPLTICSGQLICLDAKVAFDSAADFRHPQNVGMRDIEEENPLEAEANDSGMSYVSLGGNIGCICNGAGLGMSTMDTIHYFGGDPANFLDLGGSVDDARAKKAFELVIREKGVKGVVINIFGGIARTNLIAKGVCEAIDGCSYEGPVVCRIEGNGDREAREYIDSCKGNIYHADSCSEACQKMIELLKEVA